METAATFPLRDRAAQVRPDLPALGLWLLPFALVVYLGLKGGGYDPLVHSEVGIAVWWIVLLGALIGVLPAVRLRPLAWVGFGLFAAFTAWTALGIGWSESAERSVSELGRVAMYLGVFALALTARRPGSTARAVQGLSAGIALVGGFALLSRLEPEWITVGRDTATFLPGTAYRLSYPLNYWNGLAALLAIGLPLLLGVASSARTLVAQALAAAAVPMIALAGFLTFSRGGAIAAVAAILAYLALAPDRLPKLATLVVSAAGSAILIAGANQRQALSDGLLSGVAQRQGDEMLTMALVVCAGVGLMQVGIGLAVRHGQRPRWLRSPSPARATAILGASLAIAIPVSVAVGVPGTISDGWENFKQAKGPSEGASRFASAYGNGRYQYWQSAGDANATDPLKGTGPDTFEYWWARNGSGGFVRDTHSLYMQTLAETGIVGLALLSSFLLLILGTGTVRALRAPPARRIYIAAATAGCASFCVSAAAEWTWQIPVVPIAMLLLAAVALASGGRIRRQGHRLVPARLTLAIVAVACITAIAVPFAATAALRESQADARAARLDAALDKARTAAATQPYAATPRLQEALLLEVQGDLDSAVRAARQAIVKEQTNWRTWVVLSRLQAKRGKAKQAVTAYERARFLNPRSPLFR